MQNYFLTLARYHAWATDKLLAEVALMSDAGYYKDSGLFFKSVHGTLNHMLVAEQHWYSRFSDGISLRLALNAELEPDRLAVANALRSAIQRWEQLLRDVPSRRFDEKISYTRVSGEPVTTPFAATLAHVFNHGTHHRGQISTALTQLGLPAPEMDIIYMLQAEVKK